MTERRLILLVGCVLAAGFPAYARPVTVASLNVENYLLTNRWVDGRFRPDYPKPEKEKAALRKLVRTVSPDILVLEEMGGEPFLHEFQQDLAADGVAYPFCAILQGPDNQRHLAVLSRIRFLRIHEHPRVAFPYDGGSAVVKRGVLEIVFPSAGGPWSLFALHLKSRLTERPDDPQAARRRLGEARAARNLILSEYPHPAEERFLIVGDFNDGPNSPALQALRRRGKTEIAAPVETTDSRGERWTYYYARDDVYSRVDYLLASPGCQKWLKPDSGKIADAIPVGIGSDHRMVTVTLELPDPAKKAGAPTAAATRRESEPGLR